MSEPAYQSFLSKIREARDFILDETKKKSRLLILTHFDADGLAAGGIIGKALMRIGSTFQMRTVKQLDEETISEALTVEPDAVVFSETGSGYLDAIEKALKKQKGLILDHHKPLGQPPPNLVHINPHEYGIDGARDLSGSGVVYLVAKTIDESNVDLSPLAVVGALGDMQDKNEKRTLRGVNQFIVEDAVKNGLVRTETDLILYGRETRPIHKALAFTTNPFLPGLSGEEDKCLELLSSAGIPLENEGKWRSVADLSLEEKQNLLTKIIQHIASLGFPGNVALNLIGTSYTLVHEQKATQLRDAREFSSLLNACGRMRKPGIALQICLGERGAILDEVQQLVLEYRQTLAKYVDWLTQAREKIVELKTAYVVHGEGVIDDNMTGAISSMVSSAGILGTDKALIVIAKTPSGKIRVSARAPRTLVEKNVNLDIALRESAQKASGIGGGHDVAAGAQVPEEKLEAFLRDVDETIFKQMGLTKS
jgi:RecJ-like exonuclease